jgi:hypothetical protein
MRDVIPLIAATGAALAVVAGGAAAAGPSTGAAQTSQAPRSTVSVSLITRDPEAGRQRLRVRVTIGAPSDDWSSTRARRGIVLRHRGACRARLAFRPALHTVGPGEPTGRRARLANVRFSQFVGSTTSVRFFNGSVQGDFLIGQRTGSNELRGRLAAFGGTVRGRASLRSRSIELDVTGRLESTCERAAVRVLLDEIATSRQLTAVLAGLIAPPSMPPPAYGRVTAFRRRCPAGPR